VTTWSACAVTGRRDLSAAQVTWLRPELDRVLKKLINEHGTIDAACGMARGADLEFGWAAIHARLRLYAHVPYPQQPFGHGWTDADRDSYSRLLARCESRVIYGRHPAVGLLFKRNDGLLDFAADGVLLAVWDPRQRKGGTFDTVMKAVRRGLSVIHMDPAAQRTHGPSCRCVATLGTKS
jgi:hypothetical protein